MTNYYCPRRNEYIRLNVFILLYNILLVSLCSIIIPLVKGTIIEHELAEHNVTKFIL